MSDSKITTEELEKVQGLVQKAREAEGNFMKVSLQLADLKQVSSQLFASIQEANVALQAEMQTLKETYGDIVINLQDGSFELAPTQEEAPAEIVAE